MRRPTRRESILGVALVVLVGVFVLWVPGIGPRDRPSVGSGGGGPVGGESSFTISGDIGDSLAPGVMEPLDLSLENPSDVNLVVDRITVSVTRVEAPEADVESPCGVADFEVRQLADGIEVTLGADQVDDLSGLGVARRHWPAVGMLDRPVNQDGCKQAFLTLSYEARGVEVQR